MRKAISSTVLPKLICSLSFLLLSGLVTLAVVESTIRAVTPARNITHVSKRVSNPL